MDKFYYTIEKGLNNGIIDIYDGEPTVKEENSLLNFSNENELLEALKTYKKGAIMVLSKNLKVIEAGKRLAEKLNLQISFI